MDTFTPSLDEFERLVAKREYEPALRQALAIVNNIDTLLGRTGAIEIDGVVADERKSDKPISAAKRDEKAVNFCTRYVAAFGQLITDPGFNFSLAGYEQLLSRHRWRDVLFGLSSFQNSDHLLQILSNDPDPNAEKGVRKFGFNSKNLLRALVAYSMDSRYDLGFERCWKAKPWAAATAFLYYLSSRYVFSAKAFQFRERLLEWLPKKLDEIKLGRQSLTMIASAYMHCSYAITPHKHDIKAPLIRQIRRACLQAGCQEISPLALNRPPGERPTIIVVTEFFSRNHSVFRTHSESVRSLREKFHVVGLHLNPTDKPVEEYFDECITVPRGQFFADLKTISDDILRRQPAMIYYLGVGMVSQAIALASLRLAPIQCVSFGHTASTMSPVIDYFLLPEDFVGSEKCFSEKVIALPKEAFPFVRPPKLPVSPEKRRKREKDAPLRIAIPASTMKLNATFFAVLGRIARQANTKVEFYFFPLLAVGLAHLSLKQAIHKYLPDAIVFTQLPLEPYFERLGHCDMFLCPFPYGNMNSIVDSVNFGQPGVCLDGEEAHSHADAGIFARIGLPQSLVAKTADEYVAAAVKLIDDEQWRAQCSEIAANCDLDKAFFGGDPRQFEQAISGLIWPSSKAKVSA